MKTAGEPRARAAGFSGPRPLIRAGGRLLLIVGGLVAGAAMGEILLRLFMPQLLGLRWYSREGVMLHVPGLRSTYIRPEYRTRIEIDSDGLRDREYPPGKPHGTYRVLLLGDSYAEAIQVPVEQSFPKRAEDMLRAARPDLHVEIVNAGVAGYGTADELRYLETYGGRWKPDLVLLAFYGGNDVRNNMTEEGLTREAGKLVVARKKLSAWQFRVRSARSWIAAHSHLWQFFRARLTFGVGEERGSRKVSRREGALDTAADRNPEGSAEQAETVRSE